MTPEIRQPSLPAHPCAQACDVDCPHTADFCHLQKLESLGLVVGEVAHDLNNILAIILGHAELAIDEASQAGSSVPRLGDIREAVVHAAALCRAMLAYAGRAEPIRTRVNLPELVAQLQQLLRVTVPRQSRLECVVAPRLPHLMGDPGHVRQILMNLILNAVEALGDKPGLIRLEIEPAPPMDPTVPDVPSIRIRVTDTGCGMEAEVLQKLFQPFYSTKAKGRGLGLTAVRTLVESMGGTIEAASVPGQGTTFTLYFPVLESVGEASAASLGDYLDEDPDWTSSETVLLVDDEPELRQMGSVMLARAGLRVLTASDGEEAVECFRKNAGQIDLVFLDAVMPRMGGCEALAAIRQIDPRARVVMISGHTEFDLAKRWSGSPPDDVLLKPVSARQLRRAAMKHLAVRPGSKA